MVTVFCGSVVPCIQHALYRASVMPQLPGQFASSRPGKERGAGRSPFERRAVVVQPRRAPRTGSGARVVHRRRVSRRCLSRCVAERSNGDQDGQPTGQASRSATDRREARRGVARRTEGRAHSSGRKREHCFTANARCWSGTIATAGRCSAAATRFGADGDHPFVAGSAAISASGRHTIDGTRPTGAERGGN
jgi:hypothetical protein